MEYVVKMLEIREKEKLFWQSHSRKNSIFMAYEWHEFFSSKLGAECVYYGLFCGDEMLAIQPSFVITRAGIDVWHNCFEFYRNSDDFEYNKKCFEGHDENEILPYLLITSPFGYVNEIISSRALNKSEVSFFIENILKLSEQSAMKFCVFMWQEANDDIKTEVMRAHNMLENFMGCNHYLNLAHFNTFESYTKCLKKKRQENIRREQKAFHDGAYEIKPVEDKPGDILKISSLKRNLLNKYAYHEAENRAGEKAEGQKEEDKAEVDKAVSSLVDELKFLLSHEKSLLFEMSVRDTLVGYLIGFIHNETFYCSSIGFDYSKTKGGYCYFNMFYYLIDYLIHSSRHLKYIEFGGGSLEAKLMKNFRPLDYVGYYRFFSDDLDWFKQEIIDYGVKKEAYYKNMYLKLLSAQED